MKIITSTAEHAHIEVSQEEVRILNAALNEVCNAIELFEFDTRMGADRENVSVLQDQLRETLRLMRTVKT